MLKKIKLLLCKVSLVLEKKERINGTSSPHPDLGLIEMGWGCICLERILRLVSAAAVNAEASALAKELP